MKYLKTYLELNESFKDIMLGVLLSFSQLTPSFAKAHHHTTDTSIQSPENNGYDHFVNTKVIIGGKTYEYNPNSGNPGTRRSDIASQGTIKKFNNLKLQLSNDLNSLDIKDPEVLAMRQELNKQDTVNLDLVFSYLKSYSTKHGFEGKFKHITDRIDPIVRDFSTSSMTYPGSNSDIDYNSIISVNNDIAQLIKSTKSLDVTGFLACIALVLSLLALFIYAAYEGDRIGTQLGSSGQGFLSPLGID